MRKRSGTISNFRDSLTSSLREHQLSEPLRPHTARAIWAEVVGPEIAAATYAETTRSGVLFVRVKSTVWANELIFYKQDILTKLNNRLGKGVLSDIHFKASGKVRPAAPVPDQPTITPDEQDLRNVGASGPLADVARQRSRIPNPEDDRRLRTTASRVARTMAWKKENGWVACSRCGALFAPKEGELTGGICPLCATFGRSRDV